LGRAGAIPGIEYLVMPNNKSGSISIEYNLYLILIIIILFLTCVGLILTTIAADIDALMLNISVSYSIAGILIIRGVFWRVGINSCHGTFWALQLHCIKAAFWALSYQVFHAAGLSFIADGIF
jgi:hypothetical protein